MLFDNCANSRLNRLITIQMTAWIIIQIAGQMAFQMTARTYFILCFITKEKGVE